jgi:DNA topoisomerase-1
MAKNLVIVESPAKARTLSKYLGRDYQVKASVGHVVDLPKNKLGVEVDNDFRAEYQVIHGKGKIIEELRKAANNKERIYLAPDPDREGEAIAWHIADKLDKKKKKVYRILLNEITKKGVQEALQNPTQLDRNKFEAQQARRILDRLVGYQISPLLWKKVRRGLSAGRVQSVTVRIICKREQEIQAFVPEEYWSIIATLEGDTPPPFGARLWKVSEKRVDNKKFRIANEKEAKRILAGLAGAEWTVVKTDKKDRRRNPAPPFITSRLQQEAARKLGFSPSRTMIIAQKLYEGIEIGDEGAVGLITYMRTDSTRISAEALTEARHHITATFGQDYLPAQPHTYKSPKAAQEAHEAIRPTSLAHTPEQVAPYIGRAELALYTLIWNRFIASQMASALFEQTTVDIKARDCLFRATGQVLQFDGFLRLYSEGKDDKQEDEEERHLTDGQPLDSAQDRLTPQLPPLSKGDRLHLLQLTPNQHFTQPSPRFTQATLIKELEEKGIGRPSTYASIMSTILNKEYVEEDEQRRLKPTGLGLLVTDLLVEAFPDILNAEFTANMEGTLDRIEENQESWLKVMKQFYGSFVADLQRAETEMREVKRDGEPTDLTCSECAGKVVIRWGRNGEFLACTNYPSCTFTSNFIRDDQGQIQMVERPAAVLTEEPCEQCGRPMQVRVGRYGKFLGCSGYPECTNIKALRQLTTLGISCPQCHEGEILQRHSRRGKVFYGCSRYPSCRFASWDRPVDAPCPRCSSPFLVEKTTKRAGTVRRCFDKECGYQEEVEAAAAMG